MVAALAVASGGVLLSFQDISSLVRNHREVRYLVTPANTVVSLSSVLLQSPPGPKAALLPVGIDAVQRRATDSKPRLLVLVIGETARAENWGLNGYARQTTPELARIEGLVNFTDVDACGSSTEVSLPCMFSRYGRRHYDEDAIGRHQSLLHVLDHAGIPVLWRDNQSGCKGVCEGLDTQRLHDARDPMLCNEQRCLDEILLPGLLEAIQHGPGDRVVVLHQLGNHGPSYFERYPRGFEHYAPACNTAELGHCPRQDIVNAYDNALRYTDHFLASTIRLLQSQERYDAAMIYVSDHGESLGEKGLYLHGLPYAIAPRQQLKVPMVMWLSPSFAGAAKLDTACLDRRAKQPASHDNLFPSVLGLMQVATHEYLAESDLFAACRVQS
jgi:lipid A ethanolaminephosphotransferase